MKNQFRFKDWSRRTFLKFAPLLGAGASVSIFTKPTNTSGKTPDIPSITQSPYDLKNLGKINPDLIKYEEVKSIPLKEEIKRIEVGKDGAIWVSSGKNIIVLSPEGGLKSKIKLSHDVRCFHLSNDRLIIGFKDFIEIYKPDGNKIKNWESFGKKAWLTAIVDFDGEIFVADCGNRRVIRCNENGEIKSNIDGKSEERSGGFIIPSPYFDMGKGTDGLLWVANTGRHRIEAYNKDGRLVKWWGKPSFAIDGFCGCCNPSYFKITKEGKFVTSEKGLVRIKVYSSAGELESVVGGMEAFPSYYKSSNSEPVGLDIAVDEIGKVYVADVIEKKIRVFKEKPV